MTSTDGPRDSAPKAGAKRRKTAKSDKQDQLAAQAHLAGADTEALVDAHADLDEELLDVAQTDEEPDNIALLDAGPDDGADEADHAAEFVDEADPDVAAVDKVLSASRKEQAADKNSSIRRMLEERSEARRMQQDLDYLDFDD